MSVKELPKIDVSTNENQSIDKRSKFNLKTDDKFIKKISNDSTDYELRSKKNSSQ